MSTEKQKISPFFFRGDQKSINRERQGGGDYSVHIDVHVLVLNAQLLHIYSHALNAGVMCIEALTALAVPEPLADRPPVHLGVDKLIALSRHVAAAVMSHLHDIALEPLSLLGHKVIVAHPLGVA